MFSAVLLCVLYCREILLNSVRTKSVCPYDLRSSTANKKLTNSEAPVGTGQHSGIGKGRKTGRNLDGPVLNRTN